MKLPLFAASLFLALSSCNKPITKVAPPAIAAISALNCSAAVVSAAPLTGSAYSGTFTVPYSGGNGLAHAAGSAIASTGVAGLAATLQAGTLARGAGNITYTITGTPAESGTAFFDLTFGGQSCRLALDVRDTTVAQFGTPFANVPDRQDVTIYQVNTRAFSTQSNFQGVIARLDSIKALGANVIYLMPIYPVGSLKSVNSPYAVRDYRAVNPEFGTLADLRALVAGAHDRNMSVILDWVANHTAWDHPWTGSHKDWYLQDGAGNIVSPPGMGWNDVAQLNFSHPALRLEMIKNMKYWVYAANIDGFRFDYADGPPFDFWKQAVDTLRNITSHQLLLLAEGSRSNHFTAGFDFTFGFRFFGQLKNIYEKGRPVTSIDSLNSSEYMLATDGQQVVRYLTNHDVNGSDGTPLELFGGHKGSMAAFVVAAYMKSVPMIYNGQEVGTPYRLTFPFTGADINWNLNPDITAEYKSIIAFRNSSAAIRRGLLTSYSNTDICAFTKEQGTEKVLVVSNLRDRTVPYSLPAGLSGTTWTNAFTGAAVSLADQLTLAPFEYLVLKK